MLFCLSLCDETQRVILDQDYYGEVLAMVEGRNWKEARREALKETVLDSFFHVRGHGWMQRRTQG